MSARGSMGSPTLLLVPTALEERALLELGGFPAGLALVERCGFGPVAAAARTAQLLATLKPARVVLIGIAGTYDPIAHRIGSAQTFDGVAIDGVGAGAGSTAVGSRALGFAQWDPGTGSSPIYESLTLAQGREPMPAKPAGHAPLLLTVCGASDSVDTAQARKHRFPAACAEDMEGFGVAFACALAHTPLVIVRGLANVAGDRDVAHWEIGAALAAARLLVLTVLDAHAGRSGARS